VRAVREAQSVSRPAAFQGEQAVEVVHDPVVMTDAFEGGAVPDFTDVPFRVSDRGFRPPVPGGGITGQQETDAFQIGVDHLM